MNSLLGLGSPLLQISASRRALTSFIRGVQPATKHPLRQKTLLSAFHPLVALPAGYYGLFLATLLRVASTKLLGLKHSKESGNKACQSAPFHQNEVHAITSTKARFLRV